jgi:Arc/MetJ-type ribon-helix-helix transcriptional regulator
MAKSKRVLFTFDPQSYENLRRLTAQGPFASMAEAVRDSVQMSKVLRKQAEQGFTEVVVRNPATKEERVLVIPSLQDLSEDSERA